MAIDWPDVEAKARAMKVATVRVIEVTSAVNANEIAGRPLHADTLHDLQTIDGPVVRAEALHAWNDLNAAMNS